jgi:hypothetical protein
MLASLLLTVRGCGSEKQQWHCSSDCIPLLLLSDYPPLNAYNTALLAADRGIVV